MVKVRVLFWERLAGLAVALGIVVLALVSDAQSARSASSARASETLWFAMCELQADRYIVCSVADRRINEYLSKNRTLPAGTAFGNYIADYFLANGCAVGSFKDGLRVNGVFISWDTNVLPNVSCGGKSLRVTFQPDRMMIADLVNLYLEERPVVKIKK